MIFWQQMYICGLFNVLKYVYPMILLPSKQIADSHSTRDEVQLTPAKKAVQASSDSSDVAAITYTFFTKCT